MNDETYYNAADEINRRKRRAVKARAGTHDYDGQLGVAVDDDLPALVWQRADGLHRKIMMRFHQNERGVINYMAKSSFCRSCYYAPCQCERRRFVIRKLRETGLREEA